ncbi:MAG: hypothetical protein KBA71_00955 [Opitutaceae bacterium]|nr:hypothetical protein [Opitutaceae bacterium]
MNWSSLDWDALDRLRAQFLGGVTPSTPYWKSPNDLATYDLTYGERIGWKWDAVLAELRLRRWAPPATERLRVFDWGCGSGIAGRRVVGWLGAESVASLSVWDHSPLARRFAVGRAREQFRELAIHESTQAEAACDLLVVSHVLNELSPEEEQSLLKCFPQAHAVLWVEPGTHPVARALQRHRDNLRSAFRVVAPCTHQADCGLLSPGNEHHWCHHFAPPPPGVHADGNWVRFGQRAGIDLRSLPYSFLVLDRQSTPNPHEPRDAPTARIIGRPDAFKPYVRLLGCEKEGVHELSVMKRDCPALYKQLDRARGPLLYRWQRNGDQILSGRPWPEE